MSNEKQIPEVDHNIPWTCTDPDNFQYGRKMSPGVYQFKEYDRNIADGKFYKLKAMDYEEAKKIVDADFNTPDFWIDDTIVLANFNDKEIHEHISAYYDSLDAIKEIYGDDWEWIVAECIFEQQSGLY